MQDLQNWRCSRIIYPNHSSIKRWMSEMQQTTNHKVPLWPKLIKRFKWSANQQMIRKTKISNFTKTPATNLLNQSESLHRRYKKSMPTTKVMIKEDRIKFLKWTMSITHSEDWLISIIRAQSLPSQQLTTPDCWMTPHLILFSETMKFSERT